MRLYRLPFYLISFFACAFVFLCLVTPNIVSADIFDTGVGPDETLATNPKERTSTVTASVRDRIPPSTPILVSPENGSILNLVPFPFIWKASSDSYGIAKYILYLDGNVYKDDITSSTQGYSETDGTITWTPTGIISDGTHTWKVRAVDANGNTADSTTWSFTVDTTPPALIITSIGGKEVSITSQDSSTIPTSPILLKETSPKIVGKTDTNTVVKITLHLPLGVTTLLETTSDDQGNFTITLASLPKDKLITIDFLTQDGAGNISVIAGVPIKIVTEYVVIPLPPPIVDIIPPIPVPPTPEEIKETIKHVIETPFTQSLPYKQATQIFGIFPFLALLIGLLLPTLAFLSVLRRSGVGLQEFGISLFIHILRALYILPPPKDRGIVFDSDTQKPVPYAYVQAVSVKDYRTIGTTMTNKQGIYGDIALDPGEYVVRVLHRDYTFPTNKEKGRFLRIEEFYKGEIFPTHQFQHLPPLFIPVDYRHTTKDGIRNTSYEATLTNKIAAMPTPPVLLITILLVVLAIGYPSAWNIAMGFLYVLTLLKRVRRRYQTARCVGTIVDKENTPLKQAFILFEKEHSNAVSFSQTNESGYFEAYIDAGKYEASITHPDHFRSTQELDLSSKEVVLLTIHEK